MIHKLEDLYVVHNGYIDNPFNDVRMVFADYDEAAAFADNLNEVDRIKYAESNPDSEYNYARTYTVVKFTEVMDRLFEEEYERGHDNGFAAGEEEGRDSGYDSGWEDGKEDGHKEGYREGYDEGFENGKQESSAE